jgi:hypothetical protein
VGFIYGVASGGIYYYFHRRRFQQAVVKVELPEESEEDINRPAEEEATVIGLPRV